MDELARRTPVASPAAGLSVVEAPARSAHDVRALHALVTAGLIILFSTVLIRTAWLSDDAYITLRTVDNLVSGFGPRWNVAERAQAYTHPLWMFLLAVPYWFTREAYFTPLAVSMLLSLAAVGLLVEGISGTLATSVVAVVVLTCSKAFVEYSTSGLENPLTNALLVVFLITYWRDRKPSLTRLWLVTALILLNRLDLGLLVLPASFAATTRAGTRAGVASVIRGLMPLVIWELFSVVYYGFPFPNTAYAKLQTGVGAGTLMGQGTFYLIDSMMQDPVTLLATVAFAMAGYRARPRENWPLALGILLYLTYVVRIGGDFMSGRLLTAPLLCATALFARIDWPFPRIVAPAIAATAVILGIFATTRPAITSGRNTFILNPDDGFGVSQIADERAFYYRYTGLLRWSRAAPLPRYLEESLGREARTNPGVVVHESVGLFGYFAGPGVHIVDPMALGDPLLARLPAEPTWRIGHFQRKVPEGYVESIRAGQNRIVDPDIALKYEELKTITQGPLWTRRRWREIAALNLGIRE